MYELVIPEVSINTVGSRIMSELTETIFDVGVADYVPCYKCDVTDMVDGVLTEIEASGDVMVLGADVTEIGDLLLLVCDA